jgi:hypothetical protein
MRYGARTDMAWFGKFPAGVSGFEIPGKCDFIEHCDSY